MSAHSAATDWCPGCRGKFLFLLNHVPHCPKPNDFTRALAVKLRSEGTSTGVQGS